MSSEELYYHISGGYVNKIHYVCGQRIPISSVKNDINSLKTYHF